MAKLIIVHGAVASGKTTFAKRLSQHLLIPVFHKDHFMETLFDTVGYKMVEQRKKYGHASYQMLFKVAEELLNKDISCMLEGNFKNEFHEVPLQKLIAKFQPEVTQYYLVAEPETLKKRFLERMQNPEERHPGHNDLAHPEAVHLRPMAPLHIGGTLHTIDTTSFLEDTFASFFA